MTEEESNLENKVSFNGQNSNFVIDVSDSHLSLLNAQSHVPSALLTFSTFLAKKSIDPREILVIPFQIYSRESQQLSRYEIMYVFEKKADPNFVGEEEGFCHTLKLQSEETGFKEYLNFEKNIAIEYLIPVRLFSVLNRTD